MIRTWNSLSGSTESTLLIRMALPLLLGVLSTTGVRAQGFGPDPFQPYNAQYAPFVTPVAPGPLDYGYGPGRGIRGANQFEAYLNSLQTSAAGARAGGAGVGVPHFEANRAYDRDFGRIYQPNKEADQRFDSNQANVNQLYFEYLREKDPKKRAEIFRRYNRARSRADRDLASPRGIAGAQPGSQATRREGRSTDTEAGAGVRSRDLLTAPPPATSGTTRSRTRSSGTGVDSLLGPPPPVGGRRASSAADLGLTPSQVLDRATRPDRLRTGVRPRPPGVEPPDSPPPP
jgi:hypothetical protein